MTDRKRIGIDVQRAEWSVLRAKAIEALENGRYAEAQDLLERGGEAVDELTHELLARQSELELQAAELRTASEAVRRARDRFERFFEELPQPALAIDPRSGRISRLNRLADSLFPKPAEEEAEPFLLQRFGESQEDRDLLADALDQVARSDRVITREARLRTGREMPIEAKLNLDAVADAATGDQTVLAVVIDETPLKHGISRIERAHREQRCIAEILELGTVVHASDDHILRQVPDLIAAAIDAPVRIIYGDKSYTSQFWQGSAVTTSESIGLQGRQIGTIEFGEKRATLSGSGTLSFTVPSIDEFSRTVSMQLGKLMEGRFLSRKLSEADRTSALGIVAGGVAHEFNNLLTVIMGNAESIADAPGIAASHKDAAEVILTASETAAGLVENLLSYAREQDLSPRSVDLAVALQATLPLIEATLRPDVSLDIDLDYSSAQRVSLDFGKFETAVFALVDNAQAAMPEGGVIRLSLRRIQHESESRDEIGARSVIEFSVTDTGSGMDEATRERATEPFFTTRSRAGSSGLGLSVVAGFVSQTGADLRIASDPEKGTTVSMIFPESVATVIEDRDAGS